MVSLDIGQELSASTVKAMHILNQVEAVEAASAFLKQQQQQQQQGSKGPASTAKTVTSSSSASSSSSCLDESSSSSSCSASFLGVAAVPIVDDFSISASESPFLSESPAKENETSQVQQQQHVGDDDGSLEDDMEDEESTEEEDDDELDDDKTNHKLPPSISFASTSPFDVPYDNDSNSASKDRLAQRWADAMQAMKSLTTNAQLKVYKLQSQILYLQHALNDSQTENELLRARNKQLEDRLRVYEEKEESSNNKNNNPSGLWGLAKAKVALRPSKLFSEFGNSSSSSFTVAPPISSVAQRSIKKPAATFSPPNPTAKLSAESSTAAADLYELPSVTSYCSTDTTVCDRSTSGVKSDDTVTHDLQASNSAISIGTTTTTTNTCNAEAVPSSNTREAKPLQVDQAVSTPVNAHSFQEQPPDLFASMKNLSLAERQQLQRLKQLQFLRQQGLIQHEDDVKGGPGRANPAMMNLLQRR